MTTTSSCPVCNEQNSLLLDYRKSVPTLQNNTLASIEEATAFPSGELAMRRCSCCGFVWNDAFDESAISYDNNYDNNVTESDYYLDHLNKMADRLLASIPAHQPIHYVEIGCGQGDFLALVIERSKGRVLSATGFDPSFCGSSDLPSIANIHTGFFDQTRLDLIPENTNIICSRHTIEHIQDVRSFADTLNAPMMKSGRKLFLETPDADWILKNIAVQDLFYEHCSLFTPSSMDKLLAQYNLECETSLVYDKQYLWTEAKRHSALPRNKTPVQAGTHLSDHYIEKRHELISHWADYITEQSALGKVAIWGAASKGVTFSLLLSDLPGAQIDFAIDLNQSKQKRFLPITALQVISPQDAIELGIKTIIIMNPNYKAEITELTKKLNWSVEIVVLNDTFL